MRIIEEEQLDFDDLLIAPKCSTILSRSQVNLAREFKWYDANNNKKMTTSFVPYGPSNMGTVGTCKCAKTFALQNHLACLEKHIPIDEMKDLMEDLENLARCQALDNPFYYSEKIIPSVGIRETIDNVKELHGAYGIKMIMVDAPNGYIPSLTKRVEELHIACPDAFIIAGNVVDAAGASEILKAGAKCIKVGIGNGSCCRTRVKTGVGRPQASALIEVADFAHQQGMYVLCDGGCATPGDVCKAFACGADMVISGSLFAGCEEADSPTIERNGKKFKQYYGMSSYLAQEKHFGGIRKYSASEGIEKLIPYTGTLEDAINEIDGSLRSCCTYIGCTKMKNFNRHVTFYKVHKQFNAIYEKCENING